MNPADVAQYKALYLKTARQYVTAIKDSLTQLAQSPADQALIAKAHLSAHSLGSQSLVMGFTQIGQLSRTVEYLFYGIKQTNGSVTPEMITAITQVAQTMDTILTDIEQNVAEPDMQQTITALKTQFAIGDPK